MAFGIAGRRRHFGRIRWCSLLVEECWVRTIPMILSSQFELSTKCFVEMWRVLSCHPGLFPEERLVTLIASSWNFHLEISGKNIPSKMKSDSSYHPSRVQNSQALFFNPKRIQVSWMKNMQSVHRVVVAIFFTPVSPLGDHYLWHKVWGDMSTGIADQHMWRFPCCKPSPV